MTSKKTRGMKANVQKSSGWWEDINSNTTTAQSRQLGTQQKRKRGNVQKAPNTANNKKELDLFALDKNPNRKQEDEKPPLILLDAHSPLIWSMGTLFLYIIIFACEILQNEGLEPIYRNPLGGPSDKTLVLMGAKYGPSVVGGEWWRLVAPLFLHSGLGHIILSVALKFCSVDVERLSGFWRAVVVYFASGVFGLVLSCLFIPTMVSCGSTGSQFGYIGLLLSDLISTWRGVENRNKKLIKYIVCIVVTLIAGLTPFVDNFSHIGGFIVGFFVALMILPNMSFGFAEQICHGIIAFLAFPVFSIIFCICTVLVFRSIDPASSWCSFCHHINCINISGWCPPIIHNDHNTFYI
jgi:membrane associated rhomboid family serine protease